MGRAPKPSKLTDYDTTELEFWRLRYLPAGSVLVFLDPEAAQADLVESAVLVLSTESQPDGVWVKAKFLGANQEEAKERLQKFFRKRSSRIHICSVDHLGDCRDRDTPGLHLQKFTWYPPGDFKADWLSRQALKSVAEGPKLCMEEQKKQEATTSARREKETEKDGRSRTSDVEERLAKLRRPSAFRVRFAGDPEPRNSPREVDGPRGSARDGPGHRAESYGPLVVRKPPRTPVKKEVIEVDSEPENRKAKERSLGKALAAAAASQAAGEERKKNKKRKKSRSRSRGRRRSRRKRRSSSEESGSRSSCGTSSSSASLMPPLKKKALRSPGTVFKMLEDHATERLAQDATLEEESNTQGRSSLRGKFHAFYQLCLRPQMDPKSRDSKELYLLSRALDLLKQGALEQLADVLASRMMAVEAATRQGWGTARYLEVLDEGDEASTPAHILLAAQRHSKLVEKAGGKGSWTRQQTWYGDWGYGSQPKGKAKDNKGKGKKGKSKGKGGKNQWTGWTDEKGKGGDAGATKKDGEK